MNFTGSNTEQLVVKLETQLIPIDAFDVHHKRVSILVNRSDAERGLTDGTALYYGDEGWYFTAFRSVISVHYVPF